MTLGNRKGADLIDGIDFTVDGATRLSTAKTYDGLNRLTSNTICTAMQLKNYGPEKDKKRENPNPTESFRLR